MDKPEDEVTTNPTERDRDMTPDEMADFEEKVVQRGERESTTDDPKPAPPILPPD